MLRLFRRIARPYHLNVLKPRLPDLRARRIMLTHMNPAMLAHLDEVRAAGALVAEDGAGHRPLSQRDPLNLFVFGTELIDS